MPSPAAASAVRPRGFRQHRGMRSFDAKSRRLFAWKARVSRANTSRRDVNANVAPSALPRDHVDVFAEIPVNVVGPCESGPSLNISVSSSPVTPVAMGEADVARSVVVGFGGSNSIIVEAPSAIPRLGSFCEQLRIWSVNVRKLVLRKAELEARLANANVFCYSKKPGFPNRLKRCKSLGSMWSGGSIVPKDPKPVSVELLCMLGTQLRTLVCCHIPRPRSVCGALCIRISVCFSSVTGTDLPTMATLQFHLWQTKCPSSEKMWWASFLLAI